MDSNALAGSAGRARGHACRRARPGLDPRSTVDDRLAEGRRGARWERAPFDHPELLIPNGHLRNEAVVVDLNRDGKADDSPRLIPAVGAGGRSVLVGPLQPFLP